LVSLLKKQTIKFRLYCYPAFLWNFSNILQGKEIILNYCKN